MNLQKIVQEHQDRIVYLFVDDNNEVQGINFQFGLNADMNYQKIDPVLTEEFRKQDGTLSLFTRIDNVVEWKTNIILEESKVKRDLIDFKLWFDTQCMADLEGFKEQEGFQFMPLEITYHDKTIELPMHSQLYDDFMEFLNQQIDNE